MRNRTSARIVLAATAVATLLGGLVAAPAQAATRPAAPKASAADHVDVYTGDLTPAQLQRLRSVGVDREDVQTGRASRGRVHVEVTTTGTSVRRSGLPLRLKQVGGRSVADRATTKATGVFRPYSGTGGLRAELLQVAKDHPDVAQAVDIGRTRTGKPITAVRLTRDVRHVRPGARKAVVFQGAQHAREWITPETVRREMLWFLDHDGSDARVTKVLDTTDLWFIPVVNVDGYDYTFTPDNRLWRKNLRDNDGDGKITGVDGVDPNRNFPYKWGYDDEGSSSEPSSETYRGPSAGSEPETQAQVRLYQRIKPVYLINYHSAAQLLLHGVGWQVSTRTPDDVIYDALLGDIDHPAVPGYVPELGAQLYTTNGETDGHVENVFGALTITPEESTCETASGYDPDDQWDPADCGSVFEFPDDETLIEKEFRKNLPLALDVARSAHRPDRPYSPVGRSVPDFEVDGFTTAYANAGGSRQPVGAYIRRSLGHKRLHYRVNGGRTRTVAVHEYRGGQTYQGDENSVWFAEYRGTLTQRPGQRIEAWFTAGGKSSKHVRWTVRDQKRAQVLVIADEDYTGINPKYPAGTNAPKYAAQYQASLARNGYKARVWDFDKRGVPHDLGVLGHFQAVVWYLGDNRLTQTERDRLVEAPGGGYPDSEVAVKEFDLTNRIRDYLNAGGKLLHTGETVGYDGPLAQANGGGIYYGLKGHPEKGCVLTTSFTDDCEILSNDFDQYWLGAYTRFVVPGPTGVVGGRGITTAPLGGAASNPSNESGGFQVTSTVLPVRTYPQFRSWKAGDYTGAAAPVEPVEGQYYVAGPHVDDAYRRLTRTVDLTGVTAAQQPALHAQLSWDTEPGYDHVIVEAHTDGADDWTTLPEASGLTSTQVPQDCEQDFLLDEHPWLEHYLTRGNPCKATGSSGSWNSFTGDGGRWRATTFDLSAYAGKKVDVSFAYVSDPFTGGKGLFVDDTSVTTTAGTVDSEGFETGLGPWRIEGAPAGSPGNRGEFVRSTAVIDSVSAVATRRTLTLGFGVEQVKGQAARDRLLGKAMRTLLR